MQKPSFKAMCLTALSLLLAACNHQPTNNAEVNQTDAEAVSSHATPAAIQQAQAGQKNAPKLSEQNKAYADQCAKNDKESCKKLVENLAQECLHDNAQSCVDSGVIFIKLNEEAVKAKNNELAAQSYNLAVGSLLRACNLNNQGACKSLSQLSQKIFKNLKQVKAQCETNKDQQSCEAFQKAKSLLDQSCKSGHKQDCEYAQQL